MKRLETSKRIAASAFLPGRVNQCTPYEEGIHMARIDGPAYTGKLTSDLTDVQDLLVDLPPGELRGARGEREGIEGVLGELAHAIPHYGDAAEIHAALYARVVEATTNLERLRAKEMLLEKQLEVVRETRGKIENNREDDLSAIAAKAAETATRQNRPELLAHFEKTIQYRAQTGLKALATRKKNEQAEQASSNEPPH